MLCVYSKTLLSSVKNYWSEENQNKLRLQTEAMNLTYSWESRCNEWKNFFNEARKSKS